VTRLLTRVATVLLVLAATLMAPTAGSTPASPASAADLQFFEPGNIVSDAVFFDALSLDAPGIQYFLNVKGSGCARGTDGSACLKDYATPTTNRVADSWCRGYTGAPLESAARIIANVANSCGVSPKVLLVLIQKEQGLVTGTNPSALKYTKAAGYACPDNGNGCDPAYAGLMNQLYNAARQFQRYAAGLAGSYRAGRDNVISYYPAGAAYDNVGNARCSTKTVYIQNVATAGLYNYTPYVPNQAALNAGYGTGDACSAYGNRNFWNYFTDWFGSTQSPGAAAILARYTALGGKAGWLGPATSGYVCGITRGGCYMHFAGGSVYWSPGSGAHATRGDVRQAWWSLGWEAGAVGYPLSDEICGLTGGGCFQLFEGGSIYWSYGTGARLVRGTIRDKWNTTGAEFGSLGYPTANEQCGLVRNGCSQRFVGGTVYWSRATGSRVVKGALLDRWKTLKAEKGVLGFPTTDELCGLTGNGCLQAFEGGSLYWSPASGGAMVRGAIRDRWGALGSERSALGYPVGDELCGLTGGGCVSTFQHGAVAWSAATGARVLRGEIQSAWTALGRDRSSLGYPTMNTFCGLSASGCYQTFQNGIEYWTPATGAHLVRGVISARWAELGFETSVLGYPTVDEKCGLAGGGCISVFEKGALFYTGTRGALVVRGGVYDAWVAAGREKGVLGRPIGDTFCGLAGGGCYHVFDGGSVYWSPASGGHLVKGMIRDRWAALGWENSTLGYPTSNETCGLVRGGCQTTFQNGLIVWQYATGAHSVAGALQATWTAGGAQDGALGYPIEEPKTTAKGVTQRFEGGTLTWTSATNTVTGP